MTRVRIMETAIRDGHQSLLATRMRTEDMIPALEAMDAAGYESIGLEKDPAYFQMAIKAIPALARVHVNHASSTPGGAGGSSGVKAAKRLKANSN